MTAREKLEGTLFGILFIVGLPALIAVTATN
jgi:hypothetical protein